MSELLSTVLSLYRNPLLGRPHFFAPFTAKGVEQHDQWTSEHAFRSQLGVLLSL